jgi:hypothetical protein
VQSRQRAHAANCFLRTRTPAGRRLYPCSHPAFTLRAFSSLASVTKPQAAAAEGGKEGFSMKAEQGRRKDESTRVVSPSTALKTMQKGEQREEAKRGAPASSPGEIAGVTRCIS